MVDYLETLRGIDGPGVFTNNTPFGVARTVAVRRGNGIVSSPAAFEVFVFKYQSMEADKIVCHAWDGVNEGLDDVRIYKPSLLQFSITSGTIDGIPISYGSYSTSAQTRVATINTDSETQIIVPRYTQGDVIYAIKAPLDPIDELLDINIDGRAWAKKYGT